jgi:hypothetical protein
MYSLLIENPETGEEVEVEFTVSGGFRRATLYDPPEYPEVEFLDMPAWADPSDYEAEAVELAQQWAAEDAAEARADYYEDW